MSLRTIEIVMDLEDHFHIRIPDETASSSVTVADLQRVIVDLLAGQGRARSEALEREVWDGMLRVLAKLRYPVKEIRPESKWVGDITENG